MKSSTSLVFGSLAIASGIPQLAMAQSGDTLVAKQLAPGVSYRQFANKSGPWMMYLVRVDLTRSDIELRGVRARDSLRSRERVSEMAKRASSGGLAVLAAVNADFFELKSGENENNQVIAGEWWKGVKLTDSPYDTYDNAHVQFALDANRRPAMDRFMFDATAWVHGTATPILTLNFNPPGKPEGTALFTSRYGVNTPADTSRPTLEAPMIAAGHRGDTILYVRRGPVSAVSGSSIPHDGAVLAVYGAGLRQKEVQAMVDGDTVKIVEGTRPVLKFPSLVIGGWPRILRDGVEVAGDAAIAEGTISRNAEMRHPRTAIGFSRDSSTLFLFAVDGRSENSGGMLLTEMAGVMKTLGAWNAMNFDGGGSTTMVIDGAVVSKPSDATGEREVGNALLVLIKR